tara:strand:- start:291 stop:545 length:255 start_codon:yes stop_codon:yes gene_type:complete
LSDFSVNNNNDGYEYYWTFHKKNSEKKFVDNRVDNGVPSTGFTYAPSWRHGFQNPNPNLERGISPLTRQRVLLTVMSYRASAPA